MYALWAATVRLTRCHYVFHTHILRYIGTRPSRDPRMPTRMARCPVFSQGRANVKRRPECARAMERTGYAQPLDGITTRLTTGGGRVVEGSDVHLGTNATRPDDLSTLILCTFTSQKHLRSLSGSKVDPSSARASPVKRRSEHRHRHTFGRNPCTRAPQPVHSMHACTSHL